MPRQQDQSSVVGLYLFLGLRTIRILMAIASLAMTIHLSLHFGEHYSVSYVATSLVMLFDLTECISSLVRPIETPLRLLALGSICEIIFTILLWISFAQLAFTHLVFDEFQKGQYPSYNWQLKTSIIEATMGSLGIVFIAWNCVQGFFKKPEDDEEGMHMY